MSKIFYKSIICGILMLRMRCIVLLNIILNIAFAYNRSVHKRPFSKILQNKKTKQTKTTQFQKRLFFLIGTNFLRISLINSSINYCATTIACLCLLRCLIVCYAHCLSLCYTNRKTFTIRLKTHQINGNNYL